MKPPIALFEQIIAQFADKNIAVIDQFLSKVNYCQLRQELIAAYEENAFKKAAIGKHETITVDENIRGDEILWLDPSINLPGANSYFAQIEALKNYLNHECFTGIQDYEFHFAVYPTGTFYQKHLDVFVKDDARLFSLVLYLNENWQEDQGGVLKIYTGKDTIEITPIGNRLVLFNSALFEHEVCTTYAPRYSLTGWFKKVYLPL